MGFPFGKAQHHRRVVLGPPAPPPPPPPEEYVAHSPSPVTYSVPGGGVANVTVSAAIVNGTGDYTYFWGIGDNPGPSPDGATSFDQGVGAGASFSYEVGCSAVDNGNGFSGGTSILLLFRGF